MHKKLNIEISLTQKFILDTFMSYYKYILTVKVIELDERFKVFNSNKDNELFICKNGLRVLSSLQLPNGGLYQKGLVLPLPTNLGKSISVEFMYDVERKEYLKKLYSCLLEWSNRWWGFSSDSPSKLEIFDNHWIITCDTTSDLFLNMSKYGTC